MGRPRKDAGRDTRREILDRSLELFATHGFSGSSMRDIAKAVGVRESALYHHFPNKNAILTSLLEESGPGAVGAMMSDDVLRFIESVGVKHFLDTMAEAITALWSSERERNVLRVLMAEMPRLKEAGLFDLRTQMMKVRARIGSVLQTLSDRGLIRPIDPTVTTLKMMGPLMLLRMLHLSDVTEPPHVDDMRRELKLHVESFWNDVKPESAAAKKERRR